MLLGCGSSSSKRPRSVPGSSERRLAAERRSSPSFCSGDRTTRTVKQPTGLCSAWTPTGMDKSKPQTVGPSQQASVMDVIAGPYLCGQWPREPSRTQHTCMTDKATQTPGFWTDDWRGLNTHRRSLSWSSADHQREITGLCLQVRQCVLGVQRSTEEETEADTQCQTKLHPMSVASASVSKPGVCRLGSVNDGINRELESVFVTASWTQQQERQLQDGRCAPVPHHHRGDAHTLGTEVQLCSHGNHSLHVFFSASEPPDARNPCRGGRGLEDDRDDVNKSSSPLPLLVSSPLPLLVSSPLPLLVSSPKPNNSFVFKRVPPEGCEKIRVFEETASNGFPVFSCPDKNRVSFIPTGAGPFCPVRTQTSRAAPPQTAGPAPRTLPLQGRGAQRGLQGAQRSRHCWLQRLSWPEAPPPQLLGILGIFDRTPPIATTPYSCQYCT